MGKNKSSDDSSDSSSDDDSSSVSSDSSNNRKRKSRKEKNRKKSTHNKSRKSREKKKKSRTPSESSDSEERRPRKKTHKTRSRSRSRSKTKSKRQIVSKRPKEEEKKPVPAKPMTEEEIQKEKERKMQIRLAKARALKFEKELAERAEAAPIIQPTQPIQTGTQPLPTTQATQPIAITQPVQIAPPIQNFKPPEKKSPERTIVEEEKKDMEEEMNPEEPKKKKPGYMDELEDEEEEAETEKDTRQLNGASKANHDDDVDPLDAFMSTIQKDAVKQVAFKLTDIIPGREDNANVRTEIDHSKVITFEDLQHLQNDPTHEANGHQNGVMEDEEDEEDRRFRQALLEAAKTGKTKNAEPEALPDTDDKKKSQRQIMDDDLGDQMYMETKGEIDEDHDFVSRQKKMQDKKDLKAVDHSQIQYEPFRKNFYIETREIRELTDEQVETIRKDLGDIKVRGDCPRPIQNWYHCGLSNKLLHVLIDKKKFLEPFPIQAQAIPAIMSGKDVIGIAETGSGKTLAYLLPMFRHILDQKPLEEGDGPIGLIMAPTRELAWQIYTDAKTFTKASELRCVCVYGGAGVAGQLSELKRGAEIVVCTPGRMIDVLTTSNGKITNLRRVTYVVLDEADRMLDLGFEPQISRILQNVRPKRQTVMFSATFPKNIENLAKKILDKPVEIVVGQRGKTATNIEQIVEVMSEENKFLRLLKLLGEWSERGSILIFVDKQVDADNLFRELLKYGYYALLLHGGQDQVDRDGTLSDFKKGVRTLMVATSVCARGLDVPSIVLVINFKCPNHREDYVHRIGRTGRAGRKGTAITFITPEEDQYAIDLINALKQSNITPPDDLMELSKNYLMKIEKGEAKMYTNRNMTGSGFRFDKSEKHKVKEAKKAVRRQFGIELDFSDGADSDEDVITKKETKQTTEKKDEQLNLQLIKDPNTKAAVMQAATKAAKDVIMAGGTSEDVLQAAQHAIKAILQQYRPANTVEQGLEQALKVRDEVEAREEENGDLFSAELEINDYPQNARNKVSNKEFLTSIHDLTNCAVTLRGLYCDPTKKVPLGQKKLHLHIVGNSKFDVVAAHKEIKRELEDYARLSTNVGHVGKYKVGQ